MNNHAKLIFGSLIGALAIHGAISACSSATSGNGTKPASAAETCAQWEMAHVSTRDGTAKAPPGWEPFAYGALMNGTNGTGYYVRRCVP